MCGTRSQEGYVKPNRRLLTRKEPGRDEDYVWGMAYRIDPANAEEVKAYMGKSRARTSLINRV